MMLAGATASAQEFPPAAKNPWRLFKGITALPSPASMPSPIDGRAEGSSDRLVVCGMTLVPADPTIDPKIQAKLPTAGPKPTIRTIAPTACR
jgi:hypothetical protein